MILQQKSRKNRLFVDSLMLLIWCEVKQPFEHRRPQERKWWLDLMLPSYRTKFDTSCMPTGTGKSRMNFTTPRDFLNKKKIQTIQAFIDTHYCATRIDAKLALRDLVGDCIACALNE